MKKSILLTIVLIAVIAIAGTFIINQIKKPDFIDLLQGDNFPNINLYNADNEKLKSTDLLTSIDGEKVIFHLSNYCDACIEALDTINNIKNVFGDENITFLLLWEDTIPIRRLEKANIDLSNNFSTNNKYSLNRVKPSAFVLDKDNIVLMNTPYYESIINSLFDKSNSKLLSDKVSSFLKNSKTNKDKPLLLFFSTTNCEACSEAEKTMETLKDTVM